MSDFFAKYWYLIGGVLGSVVLVLILIRRYRRGLPPQRRRWKAYAIAAGVLILVSEPLGHLLVANSAAFDAADRFLRTNPRVIQSIGAKPG